MNSVKHKVETASAVREAARRRDAAILAHNYQIPEVQEAADFVGDSLDLSRKAAEVEAGVIVFCGVHFMAETAYILSPDKTVLLPDPEAGCPMADMIDADEVRRLRARYPDAAVVCYVNSTAEVKALSDICCTSANAVRVVRSLDAERIIFVPDKGLGAYVASQVPEKQVILCEGYCPTHYLRITAEDIEDKRRLHPGAAVIVHPECAPEAIAAADEVGSTSQILAFVRDSDAREIIVGTEIGMMHRLRAAAPDKKLYPASDLGICPNMKKINLEKILAALERNIHVVVVEEQVRAAAYQAVAAMLAVG